MKKIVMVLFISGVFFIMVVVQEYFNELKFDCIVEEIKMYIEQVIVNVFVLFFVFMFEEF